MPKLRVTYVGGPTAVIEVAGLRFLTDPTFDRAGTNYPTPAYTLRKTQSPGVDAASIGRIDAVLLTAHDPRSISPATRCGSTVSPRSASDSTSTWHC